MQNNLKQINEGSSFVHTLILFLPGLFHAAGMLSPSDKKFQYSKKGVGWTSNFNNNPRNWISIGNKRQKYAGLLMMPLLKEIKWWYTCSTSALYWNLFYFRFAISLNCCTLAPALPVIAQQLEYPGLDCLMRLYSYAIWTK